MKKIALLCVTYNSYEDLETFKLSVDNAVGEAEGQVDVDMLVADNTVENVREIQCSAKHIKVKSIAYHKNLGYFGGIKRLMDEVDCRQYDYTIISNVDIIVDAVFMKGLSQRVVERGTGWIAPQIYSENEGRDRNPKIMKRYTLYKLKLLRQMFIHPLLNYLYRQTVYRRKKYQTYEKGEIYGGHGSFIILTREYLERCGTIDYPVFLFGEEIYLAEQCLKHGLKVIYDPSLKVIDKEHTSTGNMATHFYNKCNVEALEYIIRTFY